VPSPSPEKGDETKRCDRSKSGVTDRDTIGVFAAQGETPMDLFVLETVNPSEFRVLVRKDLDIPDPKLPAAYRLERLRKFFITDLVWEDFDVAMSYTNDLLEETIEKYGLKERPSVQIITIQLPFSTG
jgi:hypothetical protein